MIDIQTAIIISYIVGWAIGFAGALFVVWPFLNFKKDK